MNDSHVYSLSSHSVKVCVCGVLFVLLCVQYVYDYMYTYTSHGVSYVSTCIRVVMAGVLVYMSSRVYVAYRVWNTVHASNKIWYITSVYFTVIVCTCKSK